MARSKLRALAAVAAALALTVGVAACGDDDDDDGGGGGGDGGGGGTIALLLPETKTTRYEEQDRPNFERRVKELCADCEVIYSNADQDPAKQQQQAEAAITQGAKVIVISAVDVASAAAIVTAREAVRRDGDRLRAPDPRRRHRLLRLDRPVQGRPAAGRGADGRDRAGRRQQTRRS